MILAGWPTVDIHKYSGAVATIEQVRVIGAAAETDSLLARATSAHLVQNIDLFSIERILIFCCDLNVPLATE